jgi:amidophosphoribosyltransferase
MCGIVGVWNPATADPTEAARLVFFSLYALQHRGQESAGIAATDGRDLRLVRRMGLVGQVFSEPDLGLLGGRAAIGHTRYSTTGSSRIQNAQPMVVSAEALGELALGHNGNCINARDLRADLTQSGIRFATSSDTEVVAQMIAAEEGATWDERLIRALPKLRGAWSLVILAPSALYAVRDPLGVRPLCLGRKAGACVFEHVYLASASSDLGGVSVYATRERMGETLAEEQPAEADVVIPVPDSAIPAAVGYARRSGIPFREGLIKNRYIGRTFIQPSPELRRQGVALKYNALRDVLDGMRVVVVDDSIVRGSTSGPIVELLRGHGAAEVHLRICSPPLRHQCFFGVDMARRDELIASRLDVEGIRRHVGADTLGYLSVEGMVRATGGNEAEFCTACFTGDYLVPVQLELAKDALETGVAT